ncbi:MAG: hypothetical protein AB7H77_09590 [Bdellovibrionales bacterium]
MATFKDIRVKDWVEKQAAGLLLKAVFIDLPEGGPLAGTIRIDFGRPVDSDFLQYTDAVAMSEDFNIISNANKSSKTRATILQTIEADLKKIRNWNAPKKPAAPHSEAFAKYIGGTLMLTKTANNVSYALLLDDEGRLMMKAHDAPAEQIDKANPIARAIASAFFLRPEVLAFAEEMEAKLRWHDNKGGWQNCSHADLLERLREETGELQAAVDGKCAASIIVKECADVANFAMMIADNADAGRGLSKKDAASE